MTASDPAWQPFAAQAKEIQRISFRHGVAAGRIVDMLRTAQTAAAPQDGARPSFEPDLYLAKLERELEVCGTNSWIQRVAKTSGAEALFDREFRFLAVSLAGRTITGPDGVKIPLPESMFLGARYVSLLPSAQSFLNDEHPGFDGLKHKGFFDGGMLGVQIDLGMDYGFHVLDCVMEVWAVRTPDRGILGHSQIHEHSPAPRRSGRQGVHVRNVNYIWTRSR